MIMSSGALALFGAGVGTGLTLNAEVYDTAIRSRGMGWGSSMLKLGGIMAPGITSVILISGLQVEGVLGFITFSAMVAGVSGMFFSEVRKG